MARRRKKSDGLDGKPADDQRNGAHPRTHNIAALQDIIRETKGKYDQLNVELAGARAQVKGINKQLGDLYRNLKNDTGLTRKIAERKFAEADMEPDARAEMHDQELLIFQSLGIGEQLDWIETQKRIEERLAATVAANDETNAFPGNEDDPRPSHLKERDRQRADQTI